MDFAAENRARINEYQKNALQNQFRHFHFALEQHGRKQKEIKNKYKKQQQFRVGKRTIINVRRGFGEFFVRA